MWTTKKNQVYQKKVFPGCGNQSTKRRHKNGPALRKTKMPRPSLKTFVHSFHTWRGGTKKKREREKLVNEPWPFSAFLFVCFFFVFGGKIRRRRRRRLAFPIVTRPKQVSGVAFVSSSSRWTETPIETVPKALFGGAALSSSSFKTYLSLYFCIFSRSA